MALKDKISDKFMERAHKRWRENIDADITDILIEMQESKNQLVEKEKLNMLLTWMLSMYRYDAERLQRDITKVIAIKPYTEVSPEEAKKLLRVLWISTQLLFPEMDYSFLLNEIENFALFRRKYPDDGSSPFRY